MNQTIDLICRHASVRHFADVKLTDEQCQAILESARATSSSSFLQMVSIIRVRDPQLRVELSRLAGDQPYVASAAEFWVFCADFARNLQIAPQARLGFADQLLMGSIDCGLMAQNALTAAESLGLGGVFIGGIRNSPDAVTALLKLPEHVIPLVGLCIGVPAQQVECKPRLPLSLLVHEDGYQAVLDREQLAEYDRKMEHYYASRSSNTKQQSWSSQVRQILEKERRPFMLPYLQRQGFAQR
jgi:Nitroreductase